MGQVSDNTLLEVRHLSQYFDKNKFRAIDDISFEIQKGEVFGLVGESGSGKTTTGRCIIKLLKITDGEIFFKGRRISAGTFSLEQKLRTAKKSCGSSITETAETASSITPLADKTITSITSNGSSIAEIKKEIASRKLDTKNADKKLVTKIQMIFQDPVASLDPRMTVREIVAEGLRIDGEHNESLITQKVNDVLHTVGLRPEYAGRYPHEFSGGQRQRIGIARVLVVEPELIIADEPVSALDVSIRAQIINLLDDIRKEFGVTILFIAHDLSVVKYFCDRIAVMYRGKIVETNTSDALFANPTHEYTRSLLSAIPLPNPAAASK